MNKPLLAEVVFGSAKCMRLVTLRRDAMRTCSRNALDFEV